MKKLYKRIIAVALCLALTAALVPATVFAVDMGDIWPNVEDTPFWPGQLHLCLKGLFLGDITELFPELDIEKYELRGRCPVEGQMDNPYYLARQSSTYYVELREKTREAVLEALEVLKDNPYLFSAKPVWGGIVPGALSVSLKEQYYTYGGPYPDLRDIIPEIDIESYSDLYLSVIQASEANGNYNHKPDIVERVGSVFYIKLAEETEEAVYAAIEALKDNQYIKHAGPDYIALPAIDNDTPEGFSVADALRVLRVAAGLAEADPEIAAAFYDKDGDGEVTVYDALIVLRFAAKLA